MCSMSDKLLTLDDIRAAEKVVRESNLKVRHTPCIQVRGGSQTCSLFSEIENFNHDNWPEIWLKCENLQCTGSFKIRGVASQFDVFTRSQMDGECKAPGLVTMSAGNYGRSFGYAAKQLGLSGTVLMPDSAPDNREAVLRGFGVDVERMPSKDLLEGVRRHESMGRRFLHPFDDIKLIAGHASLGKVYCLTFPPFTNFRRIGDSGLRAGC